MSSYQGRQQQQQQQGQTQEYSTTGYSSYPQQPSSSGYGTSYGSYYGTTQQPTSSSSSNNSASNFLLTSTTAVAMQQALANVLPQNPSSVPPMTGYLPQYPPSSYPQRSVSSNSVPTNSLWMGDIEPWMDETFLYGVFSYAQDLVNVKVMKDKVTGKPQGFGFIYFSNAVAAQRVLEAYQNQPIPNAPGRYFKLNFATQGGGHNKPEFKQRGTDAGGLFIGDLGPEVTDTLLLSTFKYYYPSVNTARVVMDQQTGQPKGYGFVYFSDETEKQRALTEMQGFYIAGRPIKVNLATKKGEGRGPNPPQMNYQQPPIYPTSYEYQQPPQHYYQPYQQPRYNNREPQQRGGRFGGGRAMRNRPSYAHSGESDESNRTVFLGGVSDGTTQDMIRSLFTPYGEIANIKIPPGKGCAFVEYMNHEDAVSAIKTLGSSSILAGRSIRLAWGKPSSSQSSIGPTEKRRLDDLPPTQYPQQSYEQPSFEQPNYEHEQPYEQQHHEPTTDEPNEGLNDEDNTKKRRV